MGELRRHQSSFAAFLVVPLLTAAGLGGVLRAAPAAPPATPPATAPASAVADPDAMVGHDDVIGVWEMSTVFRGAPIPAELMIWTDGDGLEGVWLSSNRVFLLVNVRLVDGRLMFARQMGSTSLEFTGTLTADRLVGAYKAPGRELECTGTRTSAEPPAPEDRPKPAVDPTSREFLMSHYDTTKAKIDLDKIVAGGVPKDGIPALVDPKRTTVRNATYPPNDGRVAVVERGDETVAYPLGILVWHEIANDTVGGAPIAVVYCPLCDSVSVMSRRAKSPIGEDVTLEFGVSGLLYNSNVLMYDRLHLGLWSQVYLQAITGQMVGTSLAHLPVRMMTMREYRAAYPDGSVLTTETGHDRDYDVNPFAEYLISDRVFRDEGFDYGTALPPKTLGLGISDGDFTAFVPVSAAREAPVTVETPSGNVVVRGGDAGVSVESAPDGVRTVQTFYHSWSAFHPKTLVLPAEGGGAPTTAPSEGTRTGDGK